MAREARIFAGRLDSDGRLDSNAIDAMPRAAGSACVFEERS
jgi:hypothetical protein